LGGGLYVAAAFFVLVHAFTFSRSEMVTSWWLDLLFVVSILGIPIAIAMAIFRHRLWDLDVVVNRALIYGLRSTLLAGLFAPSSPSSRKRAKISWVKACVRWGRRYQP
jgi:hypothetical protein